MRATSTLLVLLCACGGGKSNPDGNSGDDGATVAQIGVVVLDLQEFAACLFLGCGCGFFRVAEFVDQFEFGGGLREGLRRIHFR